MRSAGGTRVGALPPRFDLGLNAYPDQRFTRCPRCGAATRLRKIPLALHVERVGMVVLRKSCRLCAGCDLLIVHRDELVPLITGRFTASGRPDYVLVGTVAPAVWREGLRRGSSLEEMLAHLADFRSQVTIEVRGGGWQPTGRRA